VLPRGHPVSGVRRRVAVPLPVGGGGLRPARRPALAGEVPHGRLLGGDRLPGDAGGGLRLRLAEGGLQVALSDFIVTTLDRAASLARKNSLWPMPFATACCGIELMAVGASRFDIARFGAEAMRFSPRQCDLMIVAGRVVM